METGRKHDYIPTNLAQFKEFMAKLLSYVGPKTTSTNPIWPTVPRANLIALSDSFQAFEDAYTLANATSFFIIYLLYRIIIINR